MSLFQDLRRLLGLNAAAERITSPVIWGNSETLKWRKLFVEINEEFYDVASRSDLTPVSAMELVNVGSEPLDGTGDTITVALTKIRDNLRQL
jgi:hypothetical protein